MSEVEEFVENGLTLYRFEGDKYLFNPLEQESADTVAENREESANEISDSEEEKEKKQAGLDAIAGTTVSEESETDSKKTSENPESNPENEQESEEEDNLLWDGSEH